MKQEDEQAHIDETERAGFYGKDIVDMNEAVGRLQQLNRNQLWLELR